MQNYASPDVNTSMLVGLIYFSIKCKRFTEGREIKDLGMEENYRCCLIQTCPWEKEKKKEE
jgi:hypothetical protein